MERPRTPTALRSRVKRLLKRNGLDDLAAFDRPGFSCEVPFYSRYREVAFLEEFGRDVADRLLLGLGLDYLDHVIGRPRQGPFLAALTVDRFDPTSPIVPRIFYISGTECERVRQSLVLRQPQSRLARKVDRVTRTWDEGEPLQVLDDLDTVPESPRVFVGPRTSLRDGMMTIDELSRVPAPSAG